MDSSLQRLIKLVPPPASPVATGNDEEWPQIEAEIGTPLPQNFKDYIKIYGAGQWMNFFGIVDPFYKWKHPRAEQSWRKWIQTRLEFLDEWQETHAGDVAPFRRYPAPNGLVAFGYDDNGGTLCWQNIGNPDSWPIVCLDGKLSKEYDVFDMTLTAFLAGLVSKEVFPVTFAPDLFPVRGQVFRSYENE